MTQTVAPTQITATALAGANILVSWLPIPYAGDGGSYRVFISETSGSGYTLAGQTANKTESSVQINGLTPGVTYYFVVQTHTEPNPNNQSALDSENSTEATATAWQQLSVNISGTVVLGGVPLAGVVMVGLPDGTVTDALGTYSATVDVDFSGTVTPAFAGHTFNPLSRTYTHVAADETAQDYAATLNTYTISGTVTPAMAGVVINGLPGNPVTAADGIYAATVGYGFDGTATPTLAGYAFTPAYRTYSDISANQLVQNYAASVLTFTLTYTAGANGTITGTSPQTVNYGADGSSVTAVPNTGYHFVDWSDGVLTAARTDTNVTANLSVTANFAIDTFTLTYTAGTGGTITGTTPQTANYGTDGSSVTAVPNAGYHFIDWSDGVLTAARTDTNISANINVTANFAIDTFTLTYTAGANGSITGISPQTVAHGASGTEVTAVPNTGYHFVSWSDGVLTAARTDANVTSDITVTATFAITSYTLTYTAGANGSVTGELSQTVNHAASGTAVTAVPDAGYHFVDWSDASTVNPRTRTQTSKRTSR